MGRAVRLRKVIFIVLEFYCSYLLTGVSGSGSGSGSSKSSSKGDCFSLRIDERSPLMTVVDSGSGSKHNSKGKGKGAPLLSAVFSLPLTIYRRLGHGHVDIKR